MWPGQQTSEYCLIRSQCVLKASGSISTCMQSRPAVIRSSEYEEPGFRYAFQESIALWVLGNRVGVKGLKGAILTGTVHLVALVLACRPAVTLPGHWDTLHLPTAAGKLPGAAALLWNTTREFVWSNLHVTRPNKREETFLSPAEDGEATWALVLLNGGGVKVLGVLLNVFLNDGEWVQTEKITAK